MVSHSRNLFMNIRLTASSLILMAALSACATRVPSTQASAMVPTPAPQTAPAADAAYPRLPLSNEILFGVLASRMYYLQIVEGHKYATLAENNRINLQLLAPSRGLILDRSGLKLSVNEQNFRLELVPEQVGPKPSVDVPLMLQRLQAGPHQGQQQQ